METEQSGNFNTNQNDQPHQKMNTTNQEMKNMGKKSNKKYNGDGTASLSDSYRALWWDMKERGYDPETTPLFK